MDIDVNRITSSMKHKFGITVLFKGQARVIFKPSFGAISFFVEYFVAWSLRLGQKLMSVIKTVSAIKTSNLWGCEMYEKLFIVL